MCVLYFFLISRCSKKKRQFRSDGFQPIVTMASALLAMAFNLLAMASTNKESVPWQCHVESKTNHRKEQP